jgi:hypothetical protein
MFSRRISTPSNAALLSGYCAHCVDFLYCLSGLYAANYRLSAFGFMALDELAAESGGTTGNYALQVPWGTYGLDPLENILFFCDLSVREKDWRSRAWSEGDVSAEHCLQCEVGELAGVKGARQARPLSACTTH